jgi:heptosyltransferase-2/heptosyltransferase-3
VVRFGALGDMIQLTALLRGLAGRWGRPCDVLAGSGGAPRAILAGLDSVAEVFTLGSRRTPFLLAPEQWRVAAWLRRRGPGPIYAFEELPKVFLLLQRGGIPAERWISPRELPRGDLEHAVTYLQRLMRAEPLSWREDPPPAPAEPLPMPELAVSAAEVADCRAWLAGRGWQGEPVVLLQTRSRRANRGRWPPERWAEVAAAVRRRLPAARVLLAGAPAEAPELALLAAACGDAGVEVAASDLPLRRLLALATLAHSCISLDTGPAHAAAVLGCPLVVLMGRADPRRVRPLAPARRCRVLTAWPPSRWPASRAEWEGSHRVDGIPAGEVIEAWGGLAPREG